VQRSPAASLSGWQASDVPAPAESERLAEVLDRSRRLVLAEACLARELAALPVGAWLVEPYVLVGSSRVPFVVIGPTGVFVLRATDGAWSMAELDELCLAGKALARAWPAYAGPVRAAVCTAFASAAPRAWYGGAALSGRGGWVLGVDGVREWLQGFAPAAGLGIDALRGLDRAAGPHWQRARTPRLPSRRSFG
jgi:hypothetical protein